MVRTKINITVCLCCRRQVRAGGIRVNGGKMHAECYIENHSHPYESHGCGYDKEEL